MAETIDITQLLKKFNVLEKDLENVKQKQLQTDILLHSSIARNIDLTFNKFVNIESRDIIALQTLVSQVNDSEVKTLYISLHIPVVFVSWYTAFAIFITDVSNSSIFGKF